MPDATPRHEMQIFQKISDWQDYTLLLIEKLPNKYNTTIKDGLFRLAMEVVENADMANQIKVVSLESRRKRLLLQNEILAKLTTMDRFLQLAVRRRVLSPKQLTTWAGQTLVVRNFLLAWIRSDHQRYAKKYV